MNRVRTFLLLLLVPLLPLVSQEVAPPSAFLDTDPLGARIVLDGTLLPITAPTLLRGLKPGNHTVQLWKDGYGTVTRTFSASADEVPTVEAVLPSESAVLAFPASSQVIDPQGPLDTTGNQFRYPAGMYSLADGAEGFQVRPVFPDQGLLDVAGWGLALVGTAALTTAALDAWHIKNGWVDHPGNLTMALWITGLLELPWYLSLEGRKARFFRDAAPQVSAQTEKTDQVQTLFDRGDDALQSGDLPRAEASFSQLVQSFPSSRLVPGALFRLARVHSVTGRRELALGEYRIVAETYPQAAYHDRARKALADLFEASGDTTQALGQLDQMVLTDGFFEKTDIDVQKLRLAAAQGGTHAP